MLSLNDDFIGYHPTEHNVDFSGSDTAERFVENLKLQPEDWYYRNQPISYNRNKNGHRCKDIENIDLDNYILFTGCSHTEGIGLRLEDSYAYLLSNKLNVDYYNLAVGGTGTDVVNYNIATWFAKVKKPPKLLVVQWPNHVRATVKLFENTHNYVPDPWINHGIWSTRNTSNNKNHKEIGNFLTSGEDMGYFKSLRTLAKTLVHNIAQCPIIEVTTGYDDINAGEHKLKQIDNARDIPFGHMGIQSQLINLQLLYQKVEKLLNTQNKENI